MKSPDVVVIGSGFGGSVVASHLVAAGASVVLYERGPFRDPSGTSPLDICRLLRRVSCRFGEVNLDPDGVYDVHVGRAMTIVSSSQVGGGSHVYFAMNERPLRRDYWDGHVDEISAETMEVHYQWMLDRMGASATDGSQHRRLAADPTPGIDVNVPQPAVSRTPAGGNVTLDRLLVVPSMSSGLAVFASHECLAIVRDGSRFRATIFDHRRKRYHHVVAPRVVVACGTLNTMRLLFRSRAAGGLDGMRALGLGFGGNADVVGLWRALPCGETSVKADRLARFAVRGDPGCATLTASTLGHDGALPLAIRRRLAGWLLLIGMGCDRADGAVRVNGDRLRIRYDSGSDRAILDIHDAFEFLTRNSGRRVHFLKRAPVTVHPLGGARLGRRRETSVVDARGTVHDHPGLYVADAAALPAAPGSPPSMTIAAWARHVAQGIATDG